MTQKRAKGIKGLIFSRTTIIVISILLQFAIFVVGTRLLREHAFVLYSFFTMLSVIVVLYLFNRDSIPELTFTWMIIVLLFPVFGTIFYIYVNSEIGYRTLKRELSKLEHAAQAPLLENEYLVRSLEKASLREANFVHYMYVNNRFPVYEKEKIQYFPSGEDKFEELKVQLLKAKEYIFMEYFIIDPGMMLDEIIDILAKKASEGVDVRFMYDGMNTISTVTFEYENYLKKRGIKAKVFSPVKPIISTTQNNRDHRKICVIDGKVAFTGGINLADEYINRINRFGHWKDAAVMITGDAVASFTMMFLTLWNAHESIYDDFSYYINTNSIVNSNPKGYLIPYGDNPYESESIGKNVYLHMIDNATKTLYIMTPYLIVEKSILDALCRTSKSGVDVRIIMPGIPDKYYAYALAKTYYRRLIESGVKIYEYVPGFVHSKVFYSDGERASVGTVNLDYRSMYHHFECGLYMYRCQEIYNIEQDFENTLKDCHRVTVTDIRHRSIIMKLVGWVLKLVAPLM